MRLKISTEGRYIVFELVLLASLFALGVALAHAQPVLTADSNRLTRTLPAPVATSTFLASAMTCNPAASP